MIIGSLIKDGIGLFVFPGFSSGYLVKTFISINKSNLFQQHLLTLFIVSSAFLAGTCITYVFYCAIASSIAKRRPSNENINLVLQKMKMKKFKTPYVALLLALLYVNTSWASFSCFIYMALYMHKDIKGSRVSDMIKNIIKTPFFYLAIITLMTQYYVCT